jgi:hypothetical protein
MDLLNVSASFLIGIGTGEGSEVRLLVSVTNPDGSPTALSLPDPNDGEWPIKVFVGLSAGLEPLRSRARSPTWKALTRRRLGSLE